VQEKSSGAQSTHGAAVQQELHFTHGAKCMKSVHMGKKVIATTHADLSPLDLCKRTLNSIKLTLRRNKQNQTKSAEIREEIYCFLLKFHLKLLKVISILGTF